MGGERVVSARRTNPLFRSADVIVLRSHRSFLRYAGSLARALTFWSRRDVSRARRLLSCVRRVDVVVDPLICCRVHSSLCCVASARLSVAATLWPSRQHSSSSRRHYGPSRQDSCPSRQHSWPTRYVSRPPRRVFRRRDPYSRRRADFPGARVWFVLGRV